MKKSVFFVLLSAVALMLAACARRVPLDRRLPIPGVFDIPAPAAGTDGAAAPEPAETPADVAEEAPAPEAEAPADEIAEPLVELSVPDGPAAGEATAEPEDSATGIDQIEAKIAEISETLDGIESAGPETAEIAPEIPENAPETPESAPETAEIAPEPAEIPETEPEPALEIPEPLPEPPEMPGIAPETPEPEAGTPEPAPEEEGIEAVLAGLPDEEPLPPPDERPAAGLAERREALSEAAAAAEPAADDGDIDELIAAHEAALSEAEALSAAIAEAESALALPEEP